MGKITQMRGKRRKVINSTHTTLGSDKILLQRKDLVDIMGNLMKTSAK